MLDGPVISFPLEFGTFANEFGRNIFAEQFPLLGQCLPFSLKSCIAFASVIFPLLPLLLPLGFDGPLRLSEGCPFDIQIVAQFLAQPRPLVVEFAAGLVKILLLLFQVGDEFFTGGKFACKLGLLCANSVLAIEHLIFEFLNPQPDTAAFPVERRELFVQVPFAAIQLLELVLQLFGYLAGLQQEFALPA